MKKMSFKKQSKNICHSINKTWYIGKRMQRNTLTCSILQNGHAGKEQKLIYRYLQNLDEMNFSKTFNHDKAVEILQDLFKMVNDYDGNAHSASKKSLVLTMSDLIHIHGGIEVILRVLFHPKVNLRKEGKSAIPAYQHKIHLYSLEVLHGICILVRNAAPVVGSYKCLLDYLFVLMEEHKTFIAASSLLEELLSANRKVVDLSSISNIEKLISFINEQNFPGFCRILSTAVADIDFSEERATLMSQDKEEKERLREKSTADANQKLLLNHPHFLKRIVDLAGKPLSYNLSLRSSTLNQSFATLLRYHDEISNRSSPSTSSSRSTSSSSASSSSQSGSRRSSTSADNLVNNPVLQSVLINEIMNKVEILYVLTLFLSGPKKAEVQTKLSELQLIPKLCDLFDTLGWHDDSSRLLHGVDSESCDFSPESALKIQVLRFVHSYCDHNEKRYLLLSENEIQEIKKLYSQNKRSDCCFIEKPKSKYICTGTKGLITKIIDILEKTPPNNALRFWHSRAIEGFLRGKVTIPDQCFLINRGLVKHLFDHLTDPETKGKEIIQSSFDLLGEVMKFNHHGYIQFNEAVTTDEQFEVFLSVMTSNIIDSNMFIRCIVLSHEQFLKSEEYDVQTCRLSGLIQKWERKIYLMYKLITAISADSLNQENVSCLNTIVVFLIYAYTNGTLSQYLNAFLSEENAQKHPGLILSNLYDLLLFWRNFYLKRLKDCTQLEQSSGILIDQWKKVVDVMLNDDHTNNTSILFYFTPNIFKRKLCTVDSLTRDL